MTFTNARQLFDSMDSDSKASVTRIFDLIRAENSNRSVYDFFAQAVESESRKIEQHKLFDKEELRECDCCGKMGALSRCLAFGIETFACDECRSGEP
jgi:hypothetical protein